MNRKLNSERIYAFSPSANVVVRVLLNKRFSHELFEETLRQLVIEIPYLNSIFDMDEEREPFLRQVGFMMPQIIYMERGNNKTYRKVIQEEERIPFVRRNNPLYRIVVLEDEVNTEILWISHRILFDEESTKRVCAAFVNHLQGGLIPEFKFVKREKLSETTNYIWNFKKKRMLRHFEKHPRIIKELSYREMFMHYYHNHKTKVEEVTFSKEETEKLIEYCAKYKVSLKSLINVCFSCAQEKYQNRNTKIFHTIVYADTSLSKHNNELGYFKETVLTEFSYTVRKSLMENVERFEKMISKIQFGKASLQSQLVQDMPVDLLADMFTHGDYEEDDYAVSELKKSIYDVKHRHGMAYLPLQEVSCEGADVFQVLPSLFMNDEKIICSLICNGCLNVTMQYNSMNTNRKDMREIMNHVIAMLEDCIKRQG